MTSTVLLSDENLEPSPHRQETSNEMEATGSALDPSQVLPVSSDLSPWPSIISLRLTQMMRSQSVRHAQRSFKMRQKPPLDAELNHAMCSNPNL